MTFWQLLFKKTRHSHHLHCSPRLCESQDATTLSGICPGVPKRKKRRPCKSCQGFVSQEAKDVKKCEKSPHSPWIALCSRYVRSKYVQCVHLPRGRTLFTFHTSCRIPVIEMRLREESELNGFLYTLTIHTIMWWKPPPLVSGWDWCDTVLSNMGVVCDFMYAVRVCLSFVTFTRGCGVNTIDTLCFYSKLVSMLSRWTAAFEPKIQSCTVDEHNFWTSGRRTRMWACLGCGP